MSNPNFSRMERVNSIVKEVVAEEVENLKDPRLEMVTITGVDTHPNLREATVYFSMLDLSQVEGARDAFEKASPRLRKVLGDQVRMKYTPALHFQVDSGVTSGNRIDMILRTLATGESEEE